MNLICEHTDYNDGYVLADGDRARAVADLTHDLLRAALDATARFRGVEIVPLSSVIDDLAESYTDLLAVAYRAPRAIVCRVFSRSNPRPDRRLPSTPSASAAAAHSARRSLYAEAVSSGRGEPRGPHCARSVSTASTFLQTSMRSSTR
jgi:hypothetical protein